MGPTPQEGWGELSDLSCISYNPSATNKISKLATNNNYLIISYGESNPIIGRLKLLITLVKSRGVCEQGKSLVELTSYTKWATQEFRGGV